MSYWYPTTSSGSCVSSASSPPCGIENGLCEKSIFPVSSSRSYIGKSTIQPKSNRSSTVSPSSLPITLRAFAATAWNVAGRRRGRTPRRPSAN